MRSKGNIKLLIYSILVSAVLISCEKEEFITDPGAKPSFSDDTLLFDTVFATIGSATKNLRVYNPYDKTLSISSIRLAGGNTSVFRMNVNGVPGREFSDIEIRAGDSIWIFVEVTINPASGQLLPFIIQDSIIFESNGTLQDVDLVAWGQNAHFLVARKQNPFLPPYVIIDTLLNNTTTWTDNLPFVIYGGYAVVDSSNTLVIEAGTQLHFSNGAGLWVYKGGTLKVNGTKEKPVVFQGLRREYFLKDEPGQWDRIWLNDGGQHEINYAVIKNAFIGLQCETLFDPAMPVSLQLTNTEIRNISGLGLFTRNYRILGWNNVIANCGLYCAALTGGGDYEFIHSTFASYWRSGQRSTPAVYLNNYLVNNSGQAVPIDLTKSEFRNSIICGNNDNELETDFKSGALNNHNFRFCLIKADNNTPTSDPAHFESIFRNNDPGFKNINEHDVHLDSLSFCREKGNPAFILPGLSPPLTLDLDGNIRPNGGSNPDLGAYDRN